MEKSTEINRKLEFKHVAGYLQHKLFFSYKCHKPALLEIKDVDYYFRCKIGYSKPVLRPLSDLYKTIIHNGKEIVPIVELANISSTDHEWRLNKSLNGWCYATDEESEIRFEYDYELETFLLTDGDIYYPVYSLPELFDYLHELKIDYRGLIDEGLAVDVNTLSTNPYK